MSEASSTAPAEGPGSPEGAVPPEGVDGAAREAGQGAGPAPTTGNRLVDEVLAGLAGVDGLPVAERLVRLTAAQEALAQILDGTGARLPGAGGPA